jgi:hypothetical protein
MTKHFRGLLSTLSRRSFLQAAAVLTACGGHEASRKSGGGGSGGNAGSGGGAGDAGVADDVPFGVWRQVRDAIRQSPDHLIAQADRVVATKDPKAIFEFVRDRFATLPAALTNLGPANRRLWGVRGTLRSGTGTLRDKAELLAELYRRAGFSAAVEEVAITYDAGFVRKVLVREVARAFEPTATPEQAARWLELLGVAAPAEAAVIDGDGARATALGDALLALLPPTAKVDDFSDVPPPAMPLVAVTVDGEKKYANVALPDAQFGDVGDRNTPRAASAATALPKVSAAFSVVTTTRPTEPVELVRADFDLEDVIGRSLYVALVPPEDLGVLLKRHPEQIQTFLPTLSLRAPDMTADELARHVYVGSALTRTADVLAIEGDTLSFNGAAIDTAPADPTKIARITRLEMIVNGATFRQVTLRISAFDAAGGSVQGLPASAFGVAEGDAPQSFTLLENRDAPPRVLFILDKSTSIPAQFLGEQAATLLRQIATSLAASEPGCEFRVLVVNANPDTGSWTTSPQALYDAAIAQRGSGSDLWDALARGARLGATAIAFITDGESTDVSDPVKLYAINAGPPAVFIKVGTAAPATLNQMAALTGGSVVTPSDHTAASSQILAFLAARQKSTYAIRYRAPIEGPPTRSVKLSLHGSAVAVTGSYAVPAVAEQKPAARVAGFLLTLSVGSESVTRVLAGVRSVTADTPSSVFDEVHQAFLGTTELRFEGAPPTTAVLLDDLLTTRLGLEGLWNAAKSADEAAVLDALLKAPAPHAMACFALHAPLANPPGGVVYPTGLRAVAYTVAPRNGREFVRKLDVTPLGPYRSTLPDGRQALAATLRATARLAILEHDFFETSTLEQLAALPLEALAPFQTIGSAVPSLPPDLLARWNTALAVLPNAHRVVPSAGSPVAFWHIDRITGSLLGILEDGAGGGQSIEQWEHDMNTTLEAFERFGAILSFGGSLGTAAGTWLSLEITKAKKLIAATVVIAGGTPTNDPTNWDDFACNAAAGAAGGAFDHLAGGTGALRAIGRLGAAYGRADSAAAAATGHSTICA